MNGTEPITKQDLKDLELAGHHCRQAAQMNYDTILPNRIRAELGHKLTKKRSRIIFLGIVMLLILAGLRQLNTVPERTVRFYGHRGIQTVHNLFGSYYQGYGSNHDADYKSKVLADVARSMGVQYR